MDQNYDNWKTAHYKASQAFEKIKNNELQRVIQGNIISIDCVNGGNVHILLDRIAGIDYIRENEMGLQGIAARAEFRRRHDNFTIRTSTKGGDYKSEYQKRVEQITNGYIIPFFTMQAFFDSDLNFKSIAVMRTTELYRFVFEHPELTYNQRSDNSFMCIPWAGIKSQGFEIKTYPALDELATMPKN